VIHLRRDKGPVQVSPDTSTKPEKAGRAIAAGRQRRRRTPGSGRKKGYKNPLGFGEVQAIDLARKACEQLGEDDPVVVEFLAMLAAIARGDPGWRGRHIGERLRAIDKFLDRRMGKPVQPVDHSGKIGFTLEDLLTGKTDSEPGTGPPGTHAPGDRED
jgi:hypothetical protein